MPVMCSLQEFEIQYPHHEIWQFWLTYKSCEIKGMKTREH